MRSLFLHKHYSLPFVFIFLSFFFSLTATGQSYEALPKKATLVIDGRNYDGYEVYFEFPAEEVTKAFWKYTKSFGHLENRKSYYKVTIPPSEASDLEVILYGKPKANGSTALFGLAPDLEAIEEDKETYMQQVRMILMEFKVDTYMKNYQEEINALTKEASKLSRAHQKLLKKGALYSQKNAATLSRLQSIEQQIGEYRQQQVVLLSVLRSVKN